MGPRPYQRDVPVPIHPRRATGVFRGATERGCGPTKGSESPLATEEDIVMSPIGAGLIGVANQIGASPHPKIYSPFRALSNADDHCLALSGHCDPAGLGML